MSIIYYRLKNWAIDHGGWIKLAIVALAIIFLSFGVGFVVGRGSSSTPIIIEKRVG
jgi:hypothetical protein